MPGVLAVLTGLDVKADGLKDIPHTPIPSKPPADILLINRDGSEHGYAPQELLPTDRVRYVGQQVVMVVAESITAAKDAAERVTVDYEPLRR
jgi:carbon-monoxide dehydrogenase large subunit